MQLQRLIAASRKPLYRNGGAAAACKSAKWISTSVPALATPKTHTVKTIFDVHTVEDLQGLSAQEILRETQSPGRAAASMRHFTGQRSSYLIWN